MHRLLRISPRVCSIVFGTSTAWTIRNCEEHPKPSTPPLNPFLIRIAAPTESTNSKTNVDVTDFTPIFGDGNLEQLILPEEIKQEILPLVEYLSNHALLYTTKEIPIPQRILIEGSPGVGKSALAAGIASQAGVPLFIVSAASLLHPLVGVSEMQLQKLFKNARDASHEWGGAVVVLEEIESLASSRSTEGLPQYKIDMLNNLFTLLDSLKPVDGIIFIGTTNFVEKLDPAFKRSGRINLTIKLKIPSDRERKQIFRLFLEGKKYSKDIISKLVSLSKDLSGADIKAWVDLAYTHAIRRKVEIESKEVTSLFASLFTTNKQTELVLLDFLVTLPSVKGPLESAEWSPERARMNAQHEAAHILMAYALNIPITCASLSETFLQPQEILTHTDMWKLIQVRMAPFFFHKRELGKADDLREARSLLKLLLRDEGYTGKYAWTPLEISIATERLLQQVIQQNQEILEEQKRRDPQLYEHVWKTLLEYKKLYESDFPLLFAGEPLSRPPPSALQRTQSESTTKFPERRTPVQLYKPLLPIHLTGKRIFSKWGITDTCEARKTGDGTLCLIFTVVDQQAAIQVVEYFRPLGVQMDFQDKMFIIAPDSVSGFLKILSHKNLVSV